MFPKKFSNLWNPTIARAQFIYRAGGYGRMVWKYLADGVTKRKSWKFRPDQAEYRERFAATLDTSRDLFSVNIPFWLYTLRPRFKTKPMFSVLEIGSFEGGSAHYILSAFPNAKVTCVDTWEGSDENQGDKEMLRLEDRFDRNIAPYAERVTKYKGTSASYFGQTPNRAPVFDFIYIDGSHRANDVLVDAVCSFDLLNKNGVIIFDDFLWRHYDDDRDNPCAAICAFIRYRKHQLKLLHVGRQVHIEKIV